jgi:hypothetical protein
MNANPNTATTQVLLVSEQAAPNLLAALDPKMKPQEAVLMVSAKMARRADALQAVLQESGVKTTRVALPDEHDLAALENTMMEVASARDGQSITINVTGGNKLMALAAQSVAQAAGWPAFYVDVDTDQIIWLDKTRPAQTLTQQLRINHYLRGYGFTLAQSIDRPETNKALQNLMSTLVLNVGTLEQPIGQLNWIGQQAEERNSLSVKLTPNQLDSRSLDALLRNFADAQVLRVEGDTLTFSNADTRFFAKGGWLEHHVYQTVCQITSDLGIRDKAANLVVQDSTGTKSEIDVALMARNRLFAIECKTARMDKPEAPKANDTLHKLSDNCRRIGGLGTRGMLATYRPLRDSELKLAKALNIEVVAGSGLARLSERLKQWVRPAG